MTDSKCPVCGCKHFYVKNPDDEYDIHEFECRDGKVYFEDDLEEGERPEVDDATETFCNKCAWHDKLKKIK